MLVKIFKILSSLVLVSILATLVVKRDFHLFTGGNAEPVPIIHSDNVTSEEIVLPVTDLKKEGQDQNSVIAPQVIATATLSTSENKPKTVTTMPKNGVYETMNEGHSDTDESYEPLVSPCKVTLGFKLGTFDTRFGIGKDDFIKQIEGAAKIWEDATGKDLFRYDPTGALTVNLVYDERQARTVDINYLTLEIENAKDAAENIKVTYEKERADYIAEGDAFTKETENFKARYQVYDDKVKKYNAEGGAPRTEYEAMMKELADLKKEGADLEARRLALVSYMETINQRVVKYNDFVAYINSLIRKSNAIGAKKFTEGRFVPSTETIDIYQFNDTLKLRRVITHELGHVLGINHTKNVQSIMYSVNAGTSTKLTKEDLSALNAVCGN